MRIKEKQGKSVGFKYENKKSIVASQYISANFIVTGRRMPFVCLCENGRDGSLRERESAEREIL